MPDNGAVVGWIIAGGGGTAAGSIVVAIIQSLGKRGHDRGEAADMATTVAARMIDRLERENAHLRSAVVAITQVLDHVIDDLPVDDPRKAQLREVNRIARLAANPVLDAPTDSSVLSQDHQTKN